MNRIITLLLAAMTMTTAWAQTWTINPTHYDANGDGQVTLEDVTMVVNAVLGRVQRPLTSLTINPANALQILGVGQTRTLTATLLPADADLPYAVWSSTDNSVATVSENGLVTARALGECQVVCTTVDGSNLSDTITVIVPEGHLYVDLGLPSGTLWATCNIGASNPEDYGDYFAWGETVPYGQEDRSNHKNYNATGSYIKTRYDWDTYKWGNAEEGELYKYYMEHEDLELLDDAAYVNWGDEWRTPSLKQINELRNNTTTTTTTMNGVYGYMLTSRTNNGNSIFFPAAGYRDMDNLEKAGNGGECRYWTSSQGGYQYMASYLHWSNAGGECSFCLGLTVRPVRVSQ